MINNVLTKKSIQNSSHFDNTLGIFVVNLEIEKCLSKILKYMYNIYDTPIAHRNRACPSEGQGKEFNSLWEYHILFIRLL